MRHKYLFHSGLIGLCLLGSGCEKTREAFGLHRHQPDEFTTPPRMLLQAPQQLDLPPPRPGAPNRGAVAAEKQARELLLPQPHEITETSLSEAALLNTAKADKAQTDIRQTVSQEADANRPQKTIINKALFWQKPEPVGEVIDPHQEREQHSSIQQRTTHEE